jgi:quinohemoprotein ethanol dehydrogenase
MRIPVPVKSSQRTFKMGKCAIALLCSAFLIEPLFAQELDWTHYGNDVYNSRFQDIDQINPTNVNQLTTAWVFHTGVGQITGARLKLEETPLVVNGVMYITSGIDDVFAVDPTTGKQIWRYNPATDMPAVTTLPVCCGLDNRGAAYGNGMIFDARLDDVLVALNAKTGAEVWQTRVDLPSNGAAMTLAPQFVVTSGGVAEVLVGVTGGEYAVRGHLDAYAAATGKLLWRFWTTEPHSWAGNSYLTGGASIWGTPTFDAALNMVYFSTGNAYPWPLASGRAGTNLYSSSIIALDATTGELQWYHQEAHHEMWDFDGPQPTLLFSWNGIPALEHTNKTGYTWILDRASGESLFPWQEVAIPPVPADATFQLAWPTQPVSSIESLTEHQVDADSLLLGAIAAPMWMPVGATPRAFQPANGGGMEWPPAAYSPRTGFLYSHAGYQPSDTGVTAAGVSLKGPALSGVKGHGVYGATNTLTGQVAWTIPILTTTPDSGMSVGGDLVFFGDSTGLFYAASAATGEILWVFDSVTVPNAGGANASPAIYEMNGVEYVVYGFGGSPNNSFLLGDAVIAFALPSALAAAAEKKPAAEKSGTLAQRARVR